MNWWHVDQIEKNPLIFSKPPHLSKIAEFSNIFVFYNALSPVPFYCSIRTQFLWQFGFLYVQS